MKGRKGKRLSDIVGPDYKGTAWEGKYIIEQGYPTGLPPGLNRNFMSVAAEPEAPQGVTDLTHPSPSSPVQQRHGHHPKQTRFPTVI